MACTNGLTPKVHRVHNLSMTLQDWMTAHHYDDAKLATELGVVTRSQVSRIRRGKSRPSATVAVKLEQVTGLPAIGFLAGEAA